MPDAPPLPQSGLTASELAIVLAELLDTLRGAEIVDTILLAGRDDLVLFLEVADRRRALHIAPGGKRARVCLTRRRFPKTAFATGPRPDRIAELLRGTRLLAFDQLDHDRRFTLHLQRPDAAQIALECELFGNRGLWLLRDPTGTILALSRLPNVAGRTLRPGDVYQPPTARPRAPDSAPGPAPRFPPPDASDAIDRAYTALDLAGEADSDRNEVERSLTQERKRRADRLAGLRRQRAAMEDVAEVRLAADMLLAYGSSLPQDATELRAPHPSRPDAEVVVPRDRRVPPHVQAQALYKKARKHEDGRAVTERQIEEACTDTAALEQLQGRLEDGDVQGVRQALEQRGVIRAAHPPKPDAARKRIDKVTGGENYRRFESVEGMLILVGRDNRQNDRLSTRVARGNDLWLHVGRGYAGSHVVVRLPKGRTASLETLLDAATLAVHFSKVRGAELEEVIYTQAKNVKKAKGMPPGRVLASRTKAIRVRLEPARLRRLLDSSQPTDPQR